jgi:cyclic pyranopterin phosphate synthase
MTFMSDVKIFLYPKPFTLRVSVLEQCQLNCGYCLPEAFQEAQLKSQRLKLICYKLFSEALKDFSMQKIRFTGGEPLLRKDLPDIVALFHEALPITPLALTTNGLLFTQQALALKKAGLRSVTFHLDSLKPERFARLMGRGEPSQVIDAIELAQELGFLVKVNCVVQKDLNHDELGDFLRFAKKYSLILRFIELMNTGSAASFVKRHFFSGKAILAEIAQSFHFEARPRDSKSDPSELFFCPELNLNFGLIASDTRPFCSACNRLRLSANGKLFGCLYENHGRPIDFYGDIRGTILEALENKKSFHPELSSSRRIFSMAQTGG